MKILVMGAGRMGTRHARGVLTSQGAHDLVMCDSMPEALETARASLGERCQVCLPNQLPSSCDLAIVATTAQDRLRTVEQVLALGPRALLIEKPLGQSLAEVQELLSLLANSSVQASVNLNMRLYPYFQELRRELSENPAMAPPFSISINTGAIGIGANGIHYLDLVLYLTGADRAELRAGAIDPEPIPSGRGPMFEDFGGWCVLEVPQGRALLSLSSRSSAIGGWEILGRNGRIYLDELNGTRVIHLRRPESEMPVHRYAAEYLPIVHEILTPPDLSALTCEWVDAAAQGLRVLPDIKSSLEAHRLMFSWLKLGGAGREQFPIT